MPKEKMQIIHPIQFIGYVSILSSRLFGVNKVANHVIDIFGIISRIMLQLNERYVLQCTFTYTFSFQTILSCISIIHQNIRLYADYTESCVDYRTGSCNQLIDKIKYKPLRTGQPYLLVALALDNHYIHLHFTVSLRSNNTVKISL